jgi:DNA-binding response OmpR family regulator
VLVADDNPVLLKLLQRRLTEWGYEAVLAEDGDEAWRILTEPDPPRIAIIDWTMPGMEGVEIVRRLRDQRPDPYIYLLMLTGRNLRKDVLQGLHSGADEFMSKPVELDILQGHLVAARRIVAAMSPGMR